MRARKGQRRLEYPAGVAVLRFRKWTLIAAAFLAVVALVNVGLAFWIGRLGGYTPVQILSGWTPDQPLGQVYPGAYVKAVDRLNLGVLQLGGALFLGFRATLVRLGTGRRAATEPHGGEPAANSARTPEAPATE